MTIAAPRVTVVVNPTARGGTAGRAAVRAIERLRGRGASVAIDGGRSLDDTRRALAAARSDRPEAVVAIGGDGTLRLAVEALHGSGIALTLIPVGTGNDFAASLGLPRDPEAAADLVFDGDLRMIDVGRVRRDDGSVSLFGTIFASGFDSKVNERANRMRRLQGRARYNAAILIEFIRLAPVPFALSWVDADGVAGSSEGRLLLTAIANTTTYGGGVPIAPDADPGDGLLDLVFVRPASRLRLVRILARAFSGRHLAFPEVLVQRVREVRLSSPGLTGYADGDPMGPLPMTVDLLPGALGIRVPQAG
ncbi:diacylglycerol kinase family protein [uncultured Microbacterium sp.]|uniref:diacylglycerol kinase family protein n=1 Tax=uncultured Microbacterium sp. TaxID=191216 RepID=UPI0026398094|nr:diacylglycerol kinase family protein [uncultured Microbacterium sp.]